MAPRGQAAPRVAADVRPHGQHRPRGWRHADHSARQERWLRQVRVRRHRSAAQGGRNLGVGLRQGRRQGPECEDLWQRDGRPCRQVLPGVHQQRLAAGLLEDALEDGLHVWPQHRQLACGRHPLPRDGAREARDHRHDDARHERHGHVFRLHPPGRAALRAPGLRDGGPHALHPGARPGGAAAWRVRG